MKTHKLVLVSRNKGKQSEIEQIIPEWIELLNLDDVNISEEIPERGETLSHNALAKSWYIYSRTGLDCFADDTGLEVDCLNGEPGVYSARYAGPECDPGKNIELLLEKMKGSKKRSAKFKTVISLIFNGKKWQFDGEIEGEIIENSKGNAGFGYDPVFKPKGYEKTFAEMSAEEKNRISHRGIAIRKMIDYLHDRERGVSMKTQGEYA